MATFRIKLPQKFIKQSTSTRKKGKQAIFQWRKKAEEEKNKQRTDLESRRSNSLKLLYFQVQTELLNVMNFYFLC